MFLKSVYPFLGSTRNHRKEAVVHKTKRLALFVSTDLNTQQVETSETDIVHDGKTYRRLDPSYFIWLRTRMLSAQKAFKAGRLADEKWNTLRERFNPIQDKAIELFGKEALQNTLQDSYKPPIDPIEKESESNGWIFPSDKKLPFSVDVALDAVAKVDAIRLQAMDQGWTEAQLYQNQGRFRFPCGDEYGLVCFVGGDRTIVGMTGSYIEIAHSIGTPRAGFHRFHNPKAPQPWIKTMEDSDGD